MGEKIVVGPITKGLKTNVTPFNVDNDSFPTLINAYQWRGRIKRKRGTSFLTRLKRFFNSLSVSYNDGPTTITLDGSGVGNLLTGFGLETNGNIVPGSVTITAPGPTVFTDPAMDGTLSPSGTINYATGVITILAQANAAVSASFNYYPDLPVMGLEDLVLNPTQFPKTLGFDTVYSYNINTTFPFDNYDVSFYKNPASGPAGYIQKINIIPTPTPTSWNGQDYQQFWTVNYQGALWATNGINVPFSPTNIGMQFAGGNSTNVITYVGNTATTLDVTITNSPLVVGDFVFANEWKGVNKDTLNFQTGYVTAAAPNTPALALKAITITFPFAAIGAGPYVPGILQYLTNRSDVTKDVIRFYDGDPTNGNATTPTLNGVHGWVNFMPPLSRGIRSIGNLPAQQYYLVGARLIVPFKDRLLFFGVVVQQSTGAPIYLQDTVVYSQNGTPYYTASFTGDPSLPNVDFHQILVPDNQTATPNSYWSDQTGFGGNITAGISQPITTVESNQDVLIVGFSVTQTQLVYSGSDIIPFNFFLINSELGSGSTFSSINMDDAVITRGNRGYVATSQQQTKRIDVEIPDEVFEISLTKNGDERFTAQRDFINEWIYFTYPSNQEDDRYKFPNETLLYNYRDNSWAIFYESYTAYGNFRKTTGFTWATVGTIFPTWRNWNEPWNSGSSTIDQPLVIAGNQQGFVIVRDDGTNESNSLYIRGFSGGIVTSPDHTLNNGDFIIITGVLGTVGQEVNGKTFSIQRATANTFALNPGIGLGTYFGGGLIKRIYKPYIQTRQFPVSWGMSRKTRLGVQQYLFSTTPNSQIQLLIFLSQNDESPYNDGPIVPSFNVTNSSLIYSTVLYTCPESTNLGLTPANINLNMVTALEQEQIWHRINTSLLGDSIQIGFTLSNDQMRSLNESGTSFVITGITPSTLGLINTTIIDTTAAFQVGQLVKITGVLGMTQINFDPSANNVYNVIASTPTTVTLEVDSTGFTPYTSGGLAIVVSNVNNFAEIECHGFILDCTPSGVLA